jgi:hypothetical protein
VAGNFGRGGAGLKANADGAVGSGPAWSERRRYNQGQQYSDEETSWLRNTGLHRSTSLSDRIGSFNERRSCLRRRRREEKSSPVRYLSKVTAVVMFQRRRGSKRSGSITT